MDLFSKLPQYDKELMIKYIREYANTAIDQQRLEDYLRFWNKNKQPFFKAFGEKFIIRKEVSIDKTQSIMVNEFSTSIQKNQLLKDFVCYYKKCCRDYSNFVLQPYLRNLITNYDSLISNKYDGGTFQLESFINKSKKIITISSGMKVIKALGKAVKCLNADIIADYCPVCGQYYSPSANMDKCSHCEAKLEKNVSAFEKFRLLHSQILNQKIITGTLCVSIHPLDFMTMSDNDCNWSSCMSWRNDGEYRLGTVEMMNSSCVVVAYLESSENMKLFEGYEWSNKKWRQLYIVNKDFIIGNRNYPYYNADLENLVFEELYNVLNNTEDFGPYIKEFVEIDNEYNNDIFDRKMHIIFYTNYMYNDLGNDTRKAYISENLINRDIPYYDCNYSGEAVCVNCGCVIEPEDGPSNSLLCSNCSGMQICELCGEWYYDNEEQYIVDGLKICQYCFENSTTDCSITGTTIMCNMDNRYYINITEEKDGLPINRNYYNYKHCIYIDPNFERLYPGKLFELFGEIKIDRYGIKSIKLDNCSHEGLKIISNEHKGLEPDFFFKLAEEKDETKREEIMNERFA